MVDARGSSGAPVVPPVVAVVTPAGPAVGITGQVSRWNIANLLTGFRLVLVVPFLLALFARGGHDTGWRLTATALFTAASLTDRFDGQLARRYGWVTDLGKFADPLADKALTGGALISLSVLGLVPWWLTAVIVVREVFVTALRSALARTAAMPASRGGKLKTLLLSVGLGLLLLPFGAHSAVHWVGIAVLLAAALVSTVTGVDYAFRGRALVRAARARVRPGA